MNNDNIRAIEGAIAANAPIMIKYNGGSRPGTIRSIIPTKISGDRVFAFCEEGNSNKSFMLAKIELQGVDGPGYSENRPLSDEDALHEVFVLYHEQWAAKGWYVEHGKDYISLFRRYKNGKLHKYPKVEIKYDPNYYFGEDIWPWGGYGIGTYKHYNKAINKFLELSLSIDPVTGK